MPEQNNDRIPQNIAANPAREREQANSLATCNKMIKGIARSAVKLNETIHATALLTAAHAKNFGDTTPCAALVDALPMSHRRSLLINWFDAFTPVGIAKDGKTQKMKGHLKGKSEERDKMWNLDAGKATPFYAMPDVEREPDVPTFESIHNNVVAFIKRIDKKVESIEDQDERRKAEAEVAKLKQAVAVAA